jgi:hypothetical protein
MYRDAMDIAFGGEEVSLTFEGHRGGRVDRALLVLGPLVAEVSTVVGLGLARTRDELAAALSSPMLTGGSSLESVEHDLPVRVELAHGKGTVQRVRDDAVQERRRSTFVLTTGQSHLHETLRQIEATPASSDR